MNRYRANRLTSYTALSLLLVAAAALGAERFRLPEWPRQAPNPDFHLLDVNHARRGLADYHGQVSIVFFGFTHCPDVCPNELFKLSLVLKRLGALASQVQVLFISLDPERDTPELLKAYVTAFDPRFAALTGTFADINDAASSFSVQFARVIQGQDYTINHSTGTYVVDKMGRLRLLATMQTSADDLVHDLRLLVGE